MQKGPGMAETISAVHHLLHIIKLKREVVFPPVFFIGLVQYRHRGNEIVKSESGFVTPSPEKERSAKISISIGRHREHLSIRPHVYVRCFPFSSRVQPISVLVLKTSSPILLLYRVSLKPIISTLS